MQTHVVRSGLQRSGVRGTTDSPVTGNRRIAFLPFRSQYADTRQPHELTRTCTTAEAVQAELAQDVNTQPSSPAAEPDASPQQQQQQQRQPRQTSKSRPQKQQQDTSSPANRPIVVQEKPVTNAILRRLAAVPEAVLRAGKADDTTTYKSLTALASAQRKLADAGKVVVYVPYTKASQFTAQLVTADASILEGFTGPGLVAKATTDAAALGNTLAYELIKHSGARLSSAGAAASAKAAEALRVARGQLLRKGFEIGVVPIFVTGAGAAGGEITVLQQQVVVQELPAPEIIAPSSSKKPVDATAAAATTLLQRQRRCLLKVRQGQLQRLSELLFKVAQAGAGAAAGAVENGAGGEVPPEAGRAARQAGKPRLLLVSYAGTTLASSTPPAATPAAIDAAGAAEGEVVAAEGEVVAAEGEAVAAEGEAVAADTETEADTGAEAEVKPETSAASAAPAVAQVPWNAYVGLKLLRSRFTMIPEARWGLAGADGPLFAKKPVVATADSALPGLVGALEGKLSRVGAAWLYSDGTVAGNRTAWEAYVAAARKMAGQADKQSLLALVRVDRSAQVQGSAAADQAAAAGQGAGQQQQQQQQQQQGKGQQEQPAGSSSSRSKQQQAGAAPSGYSLSMLLVHDDDIPRSILQAPNAPLESSKVAARPALQLLKFAAAVNSFLPVSAATGAGGLVILPAVLPADANSTASAAVDYRFAASESADKAGYDYFFRLQRFTQELPGGLDGPDVQPLRVSASTDPGKLRDAIVAKALEGQQAALRFVAPAGRLPGFMLSIAMTAVAAARVRLQSKQAGVDVGVMPLVLTADSAAAEAGAGEAKATSNSQRVVYSLRLVALPAAAVDAGQGSVLAE